MKGGVKISAVIVLVAALLAVGYYWSFRFATVRSSRSGPTTLHVAGLSFDCNEVTGRRFSHFFGPLLEHRFQQSQEIKLDATFSQLRDTTRDVSFKRDGQDGILIRYGPEHEKALRNLRRGDPVTVFYKLKAVPENPFVSCYQMIRISRR